MTLDSSNVFIITVAPQSVLWKYSLNIFYCIFDSGVQLQVISILVSVRPLHMRGRIIGPQFSKRLLLLWNIRLSGCQGLSQYLLGANAVLLVFLWYSFFYLLMRLIENLILLVNKVTSVVLILKI